MGLALTDKHWDKRVEVMLRIEPSRHSFSSCLCSIDGGWSQIRPDFPIVIGAQVAAGDFSIRQALDAYTLLGRYTSANSGIMVQPLTNDRSSNTQGPSECSLVSKNAGRSLDGLDLNCLHALNVKHNLSLDKYWHELFK